MTNESISLHNFLPPFQSTSEQQSVERGGDISQKNIPSDSFFMTQSREGIVGCHKKLIRDGFKGNKNECECFSMDNRGRTKHTIKANKLQELLIPHDVLPTFSFVIAFERRNKNKNLEIENLRKENLRGNLK